MRLVKKNYDRVNEQQKQRQRRKMGKLIGDIREYSKIDHRKTVINQVPIGPQVFLLYKDLKFFIARKTIPILAAEGSALKIKKPETAEKYDRRSEQHKIQLPKDLNLISPEWNKQL